MSEVTKEMILERLQKVRGPDGNGDLVELGLVSDIFVSGGRVAFSITVDADKANDLEPMRKAAEEVVSRIPGVESVMVALTAERKPGSGGPAPQQARPAAPGPDPAKPGVDGVKTIIAVASGKGGVGKSTTAINLALGLQANGLKVGVLDADIYGPSLPRLLKIDRMPEPPAEGKLKAFEGYGLKVMSMGFLVEEDTPMIWRGPMVMSALTQMLREVDWGDLDVMVVDMPPGTGDAQLTMAQQVPLAGAVIVSTPQDLALIDARKGLAMFKKVSVPVLGIVENMSYFLCPSCGERSDIFGHGGARAEAEKLGAPFLGEVPLHMAIRETSDAGTPVVVSDPDGPHAKIFKDIAGKVWEQVTTRQGAQRAAPKIVMD
ncbi:ATP-binding protein involved in chromosome partitioning [Rhodobium orientis]|uniref:Iron-sulfur cluster carrier protein n=1 Tax=Rhodobium orientis TaxID=34017 RepID=A0A327JU34_9HYPH|nr:iron-sulfur cluster carrier protein ApbC [Rhodobium orientis]MBB4304072.1 ATP-binding protein involved in chromosome partitioning [Rhodobium orientis]MBK5950723.1 Fe-S-binding ATPase [Rhodobium orientis]RAI29601.1 Fe-S-binding ATPase [Rhodobium orientis]